MMLTIGDVAGRTGCTVPTIRYYEQIGLIAPAARGDNGRRTYGWPDISRLRFIRRARDFGMSLEQVRELLGATVEPSGACEPAKSVVAERLADIVRKRAELADLEASLTAMLARCTAQCQATTDCCTIYDDIDRASAS